YKVGLFVPYTAAVAGDPQAMEELAQLRRVEFERIEKCIRQAHQHAADVVLDAQPRYAAEHAAWGNHLGARYHILWALRFKPALIVNFFNESGLEMMTPLLEEIVRSNHEDKDFIGRLHEVEDCRIAS